MPYPGLRAAFQRGRGDRAPPKNRLSRRFRVSSRKASFGSLGHFAEGGAGAKTQGLAPEASLMKTFSVSPLPWACI